MHNDTPQSQPNTADAPLPPQTPGKVFVLSGPSGVGKGTLCKALLAQLPQLALTISTTSRAKRPDEIHGQDYYFVDRDTFLSQVEAGAFIEWAEYNGKLYGTTLAEVEKITQAGQGVLMEIDVQGALSIQQKLPEAQLVFIAPPTLETLRQRLEKRGTNSPEDIARRLAIGESELSKQNQFDAVFVNENLEETLSRLVAFFRAALPAPSPSQS